MKKMQFKVACVKEFLEKNGFVFLVDSKDYGGVSYSDSEVGLVLRKRIKDVIIIPLLEDYLLFSGFYIGGEQEDLLEAMSNWNMQIKRFCNGKRKWLYLVVRIPPENLPQPINFLKKVKKK